MSRKCRDALDMQRGWLLGQVKKHPDADAGITVASTGASQTAKPSARRFDTFYALKASALKWLLKF